MRSGPPARPSRSSTSGARPRRRCRRAASGAGRARSGTASRSASGHVERDRRSRRASRARRLPTGSGWNLLTRRLARSVRLEVVERLEALGAAVLRLARGRAEARRARSFAVDPQRGQRHRDAATTQRADAGCTSTRVAARRMRRRDARTPASLRRASGAIQSVVHAGASAVTTRSVIADRGSGRCADVGFDDARRRAARVRRRHGDDPSVAARARTSRTMPSSTIDTIGISGSTTLPSAAPDRRDVARVSRVQRHVGRRRASPPCVRRASPPRVRDTSAAAPASRRAGATGARCGRPACRRASATPCIHVSAGTRASPRRAPRAPTTCHGARSDATSTAMPASISARSVASTANISPVYIHSASIADCIRACDSSVPSPRRTTQSRRALDVIAHLLDRLGRDVGDARVASTARAGRAAAGATDRTGTGARSCRRSCRSAARPAAGCGNSPPSRRNASCVLAAAGAPSRASTSPA